VPHLGARPAGERVAGPTMGYIPMKSRAWSITSSVTAV
jgi:hypothetical protein